MNDVANLLHYSTVALAISLNAISAGIGGGLASVAAVKAINTQPEAKSDIITVSILGIALIETAAIIGVSVALILLFTVRSHPLNFYFSIAELGILAAIGLPGFFIGIFSSLPTQAACHSIARQPFFAQKISRFMLISQSLIQTPIIFGFIFAMFINSQAIGVDNLAEALRYLAVGLSIGLGSIGPVVGMGYFAQVACQGIGFNRDIYTKLLTFTFISQAIIETPVILALVVSILLLNRTTFGFDPLLTSIAFLSAALCIGLSTIGPGISSGRMAASACRQMIHNPEQYGSLLRVSMFGQGLIDTCAIYALLISIMLLFWH